jgi:hypothetical protein
MDVNSSRPPDPVGKLPTVEKPASFGRDATATAARNHNQNIGNSWVDSRRDNRNITDVKNRRKIRNSSDATTVETPRTVLALGQGCYTVLASSSNRDARESMDTDNLSEFAEICEKLFRIVEITHF